MKKLLLREIELGRTKALKNARALIKDAEILFKARRYPRSLALAHLACEELGKIMMLASIGIESRLGNANWNKFWKRFRNHKEKTKNILGIDYMMSPIKSDDSDVEEYEKDITERFLEFENLKFKAIYSDYSYKAFHSPDEIVKRDIALAFLKLAKNRFRVVEKIERRTIGRLRYVNIKKIRTIKEILK